MMYQVKRTAVNKPIVMWWCGVGQEKHSVVRWSGLSLLVSLGHWTVNFARVSRFFSPPLRWNRVARVGWSWVFPFPQVNQALIITQQVRLWLTSFPCGQAF